MLSEAKEPQKSSGKRPFVACLADSCLPSSGHEKQRGEHGRGRESFCRPSGESRGGLSYTQCVHAERQKALCDGREHRSEESEKLSLSRKLKTQTVTVRGKSRLDECRSAVPRCARRFPLFLPSRRALLPSPLLSLLLSVLPSRRGSPVFSRSSTLRSPLCSPSFSLFATLSSFFAMGAGLSSHAGAGKKPRAESLGGERQNSPASREHVVSAVVNVPSSSGMNHVVLFGSDFVNNFAVLPPRSAGAASPPGADLRMQTSLSSLPRQGDSSLSGEPSAPTVSNEGTVAAGQAARGESLFVAEARGDSRPVGEGDATGEAWVASRVLEQKKEFFADMRRHLKSALVEQMDVLKQGLRACPLTAAAASVASATAEASLRQVAKALPEDSTVSPFDDQPDARDFQRPVCHDEQLAVLRCYNRQSMRRESEGNADYLSCHSMVADLRACSERATQLGPLVRPQN